MPLLARRRARALRHAGAAALLALAVPLTLSPAPAAAATNALAPLRAEVDARLARPGDFTPAESRALRRAADAIAPTNVDATLAVQVQAAARSYAALRRPFRDELSGADPAAEANLDDLYAAVRTTLLAEVAAEQQALEDAVACGTYGRVGFVARRLLDRLGRHVTKAEDAADPRRAFAALGPAAPLLRRCDRSVYLALGGTDVAADVGDVYWIAHGKDPVRVADGVETILYVAISRRSRFGDEHLQIQVWGFDGPGTYPVSATFTSKPLGILARSADVTGTLTVTQLDTECRRIEGTFELDVTDRTQPDVPRQVLVRDARFSGAVRFEE